MEGMLYPQKKVNEYKNKNWKYQYFKIKIVSESVVKY